MSALEIKPGNFAGDWTVKLDGREIECRSVGVYMLAGEVPEVTIVGDALPTDLTIVDAEVTFLDPVAILARTWEFYRQWGETEEPDGLALWEDLGRILRGGGE